MTYSTWNPWHFYLDNSGFKVCKWCANQTRNGRPIAQIREGGAFHLIDNDPSGYEGAWTACRFPVFKDPQ